MFRDSEYHFKKLLESVSTNQIPYHLNTIRRFLNLWQAWDYSDMGKFIENANKYTSLTNDTLPSIIYDDATLIQRKYKTYENFISNVFISQYDLYYQLVSKYKVPIICIGTWSKEDSIILKKLNTPSINFFKDRMISLKNNGITTTYMTELCDFNSNDYPYDDMLISNVYKWTKNYHPTKKFHKIIADSLINHIENLDNSN